jgi:uncharacterized protein (TIGR02118 family)
MPARILVIYQQPPDPAAFDEYYFNTHIPMARKLPKLRGIHFNAGPPVALTGPAPYLIAELNFDSMEDLQAAVTSPEGVATAADVPNFSTGQTILIYETKPDHSV